MYYYKVKVAYKGTKYFGWQIQKDNTETVQGTFHRAIDEIFKTNNYVVLASSRTDAGVHAFGQVAKIEAPFYIPCQALLRGLNSFLPDDIRVVEIEETTKEFHPTYNSKWKIYNYLFSNNPLDNNPFAYEMLPNNSYDLDFDLMNKACSLYIGKHDFKLFSCKGTPVKSTVREIFDCYIEKRPGNFWLPEHYAFVVRGEGFLKQMVRLMVGCVWDIGRGKRGIEVIEAAYAQDAVSVGPVAPPHGLYLVEVSY